MPDLPHDRLPASVLRAVRGQEARQRQLEALRASGQEIRALLEAALKELREAP